MKKVPYLIEVPDSAPEAFTAFEAALSSANESERQATSLLDRVAGFGVDIAEGATPVPMFESPGEAVPVFEGYATMEAMPDRFSATMVVEVEVPEDRVAELSQRSEVTLWPNSEIALVEENAPGRQGRQSSSASVDCAPYRPPVQMTEVSRLLDAEDLWAKGFRGEGIVVGIIDEGINGSTYPVTGGYARAGATRQPGQAPISSHGSMCAADVLVAAPNAKLYDYPFLGVPRSGGAVTMFQAALDERRRNGTPHLTSNSYGFMGVPDRRVYPNHEVWDESHPVHRKVREVVASGAACFFSAGNCGADCPDGRCLPSGIGAGQSIHASNSLAEVITVAAVNSIHERIGYSSQGPGMFERQKPDISAYSHFYGNFGPGRPAGGGADSYDSGTSASTPVAAGVAALLLSALPSLTPEKLKRALMETATQPGGGSGWNPDFGVGVVNALAAYHWLGNA